MHRTPKLRQLLASLALLSFSCSTIACASCRRDKQPDATDQDAPVPLPPTPSLPALRWVPVRNGSEFALPEHCAPVGALDFLTVGEKSVRLVAIPGSANELAIALPPPAGLGPAPVRGIVSFASHTARDLTWFDLDAPPLFASAGETWVAAFDAPSRGSRRQALVAVETHPYERVAAGDELHVAGLACRDATCALLTSRVSEVTSPGASLFFGAADIPASQWKRVDIDSQDASELPAKVVDVTSSSVQVAFASPTAVRFATVRDGQVHSDGSLDASHGVIDIASLGGAYALAAHGVPLDARGCYASGGAIVTRLHGREPQSIPVGKPPYKGVLLDLGTSYVLVWLAPVNCPNRDRLVVYTQVFSPDGTPAGTYTPVGDALDFAARTAGGTLHLYLLRDEGVYAIAARCAPPRL